MMLHAQFNQYANQIVKDGIIIQSSKTNVYENIAANFDNYSAQATYQAAKRFFKKKIHNLKSENEIKAGKESDCDDDWPPYDRHNLQSN